MIEQSVQETYGRETREYLLPLPTSADGYIRALLLGTTGAGKTTLMRQFLGTHPHLEHFPTTSGGKTTTAEFEAILREGPFQAVITFIPRRVVQAYIEECILAAAHMYLEGREDESAANKLLEHEEQRFRLRYILGDFPPRVKRTNKQGNDSIQGDVVTEEAKHFAQIIQRYLNTIRSLVATFRETIEGRLDSLHVLDEDYDVYLEERLEQELPQYPAFRTLIDEIIAAIGQRFKAITRGAIIYDRENWPLYWTLETKDRQEFLKAVNAFSSNHFSSFGKLLTPIVQGIRVAGPFYPEWRPESAPRLVLIDGEGLGHTPDTAASVSTYITSRFEEVDAIMLVDTARQPMQAASQSVLEASIVSGSISKLLICFTHFELVGGDAFADRSAREDHVRNSLDNVIASVSRRSGTRDKYSLRRSLDSNVFFLSHLDHRITMKTQTTSDKSEELLETREELRSILATLEAIKVPPMPEEIKPVYDEHSLFSYIQKAVKAFRDKWRGLLGLARTQGMPPEHWTRIKALSRRPAFLGQDEYDTLRPIADLIRELSEQLKRFLESPLRWERSYQGTEEMRQAAIDSIARELYPQLHGLIRQRLMIDPCPDWQRAYLRQGTGSTKVRARDIDSIYATAAPTLFEMMQALDLKQIYTPALPTGIGIVDRSRGEGRDEFTAQVIELVKQAIQTSGGRIIQV